MGSLGQYEGEVSNVHDVHIENVWMLNGDVSWSIYPSIGEANPCNSTPVPVSRSGQVKRLAQDMSTT